MTSLTLKRHRKKQIKSWIILTGSTFSPRFSSRLPCILRGGLFIVNIMLLVVDIALKMC